MQLVLLFRFCCRFRLGSVLCSHFQFRFSFRFYKAFLEIPFPSEKLIRTLQFESCGIWKAKEHQFTKINARYLASVANLLSWICSKLASLRLLNAAATPVFCKKLVLCSLFQHWFYFLWSAKTFISNIFSHTIPLRCWKIEFVIRWFLFTSYLSSRTITVEQSMPREYAVIVIFLVQFWNAFAWNAVHFLQRQNASWSRMSPFSYVCKNLTERFTHRQPVSKCECEMNMHAKPNLFAPNQHAHFWWTQQN